MRALYHCLYCLIGSALIFVSCSVAPRSNAVLDISIRNNTMTPLDWVKVEWDGPYLPGGILSPGISSTAVGVEAPKSDFVTLTFVEHASRTPHALRLDVTRLKRLRSGRYDVTLAVTSLETAELTIDEHTK